MEKKQTIKNIEMTFLDNKMVKIVAKSIGETLNATPFSIQILSYCKKPRTKEEVVKKFGSTGGTIFSLFENKGFLRHPKDVEVFNFNNNYTNIFGHREMLADEERLLKYKEAIFETVKKGDIVIDAGAGTGILSVYSALAGAKKVYAIAKTEMANHIKIVAQNSGVDDIVEVINDDFSKVILPQKADVIISETMGALVFEEHLIPLFQKCIANNLKKGGKIIPQAYSFSFASIKKEYDITLYPFRKREDGVDLSHFSQLSKKRTKNFIEIPKEAIKEYYTTQKFSFPTDIAQTKKKFILNFTSKIDVLGAWFDLYLSDNIVLSTSPFSKLTHWKQVQIPYQNYENNPELKMYFFYFGPKRSFLSLNIEDKDSKSEFFVG